MTAWACIQCPDHGTTDADERRHREQSHHATTTAATEDGAERVAERAGGRA